MALPIALRLSYALAVARAAIGQQEESTTPEDERALAAADDTSVEAQSSLSFDGPYLDPSSSATCPSPCSVYLAGSKASDARVCQKQGSGVGTPQENAELGVACYPSYGCGRDMIPCVNQAWSGPVPDTSDAAAACAGIDALTEENPWTCEGFETNAAACSHGTPNNNQGKWLKGNADLLGGWGANAVAAGAPTRNVYSGTSSNYECCLKAMMHENSTWDQGGAAVRFQYHGGQCIVDTEWLIYTNMDSSSGYALKYTDASGQSGDPEYFYRHATGASDAANMATGGRCVVEGGFHRAEDPAASGVNKPWGELPDGAVLPNFPCSHADRDAAGDMFMIEEACDATIKVNTINDPEACCEFCRTLDLLGADSGASVTETDGVHDNPCVAWQIVQGKCRIVRKAYFDYWNAGGPYSNHPSLQNIKFTTIQEGIMDDNSWAPGNEGWLISGRGCTNDVNGVQYDPDVWCNYYSYVYYRELGTDSSAVSAANATFRKVVTANLSADTQSMTIQLSANSVGSRRDSTENTSEDCGSVEVYEQDACSDASSGYTVATEESLAACTPLCESSCVVDGQVTLFCDNLAGQIASRRLARGERRLTQGEGVGLLFSLNSQGSGYDQVNFGMSADYAVGSGSGADPDAPAPAPATTMSADPDAPAPAPATTTGGAVDISGSERGSCPGLLVAALVSLAASAAASGTRQ